MRKLFLLTLLGAGVIAFVGADVVKGAFQRARVAVRDTLTSDMPLRTQLAEAQAQVDAYAESIIRGEIAAENLAEMIGQVDREIRVLAVRVDSGRESLVAIRSGLDADTVEVPVSAVHAAPRSDTMRSVRTFKALSGLLERRQQDRIRLTAEYENTLTSLAEAKAEQVRLAEEVQVLAAEIESLEARTSAARTRNAVGDASISRSGFDEAQKRLQKIRNTVRERNRLLEYYEYERRPVSDAALSLEMQPTDALQAIDEALAAYPLN